MKNSKTAENLMTKFGIGLIAAAFFCFFTVFAACNTAIPSEKANAEKTIVLDLSGTVSKTLKVFDYIDENGAPDIKYTAETDNHCVTVSQVTPAREFTIMAETEGEAAVTIQAIRDSAVIISVRIEVTVIDSTLRAAVTGLVPDANGYTMAGESVVDIGSDYRFTVVRKPGFIGTPSVSYTVGGTAGAPLTPAESPAGTFTFTIPSVTGNIVVEAVTGIFVRYGVDLSVGQTAVGYALTGESEAAGGVPYEFVIKRASNYIGIPAVSYTVGGAAGAPLTPAESPAGTFTFTIPAVSGDIVIEAVTGLFARYGVNLSVGENPVGFTISGEPGVTAGAPYEFVVKRASGYIGTPAVSYTVGGTAGAPLTPAESPAGTFTFTIPGNAVTGEINILSVTGLTRVYKAEGVVDGNGYTITGAAVARQGEAYVFTVARRYGYYGTPAFTMTIGGKSFAVPQADESTEGIFVYTVPAISVTGDIEIGTVNGIKADVTDAANSVALSFDFFNAANWMGTSGTVIQTGDGMYFADTQNTRRYTPPGIPSELVSANSEKVWTDNNNIIGPFQYHFMLRAEGNFAISFLSSASGANPNELRLVYVNSQIVIQRNVGGAQTNFGFAPDAETGFGINKDIRVDMVISAEKKGITASGLTDTGDTALAGVLKFQLYLNGKKVIFKNADGNTTASLPDASHAGRVDNGDVYIQRLISPTASRYLGGFVFNTSPASVHSMATTAIPNIVGTAVSGFADGSPVTVSPVSPYRDILLKDAYQDLFPIGMTVQTGNLTRYDNTGLTKQFNSLTAEYQMKWSYMQKTEGTFNWTESNTFINYAKSKGKKVRGHALVWYKSIPSWIFADIPETPDPAAKTKLLGRITNHVEAVVEHFDETVYVWDVVNEALLNSPNATQAANGDFYRTGAAETTNIGGYDWYKYCGTDYIDESFYAADRARTRAGLSDLKLFYNDYNLIFANKRNAAVKMLQGMLDRGVPIDGIGMQSHFRYDSFSAVEFEKSVKAFTDLGLDVQLTEIDISLYSASESSKTSLTAQELAERTEIQQKAFEDIFRIARKYAIPQVQGGGKVTGVTFWGVADDASWLNEGRTDYPLLFDRSFKAKPAFVKITNF